MQRLNVCVIGAGDLGTQHIQAWQRVPDAEVVAVCDLSPERAASAQQRFGIKGVYSDYESALAHSNINAVSVCTPTCWHRAVSEAAMRRGYHALCEKPLAMTLEDGEAMLAAAEECTVKFALGFCKRFLPQIQRMRELVQGGAIGRPVTYRHVSAIDVRPKRWIMDKTQGGGPVIDMACHYFDQWRLIFGGEPTRVMATGLTLSTESPLMVGLDPEADTVTMLVEFDSGDVGVLSLSWGLPESVRSRTLEDLLGPKGLINVDGSAKLTVTTAGGEEAVYEDLGAEMIAEEVAAFADAVRHDKPVAAAGEDGLIALRVSLAALESITTGRAVAV